MLTIKDGHLMCEGIEVKPCPLCGEYRTIEVEYTLTQNSIHGMIRCKSCDLRLHRQGTRSKIAKNLTKAWNKRPKEVKV